MGTGEEASYGNGRSGSTEMIDTFYGVPFFKGEVVVLCLAVSVPSCGKAAAYLSSSLIAVSWSQGVVVFLLPSAKPVILLLILEGVCFTVE